MKKHTDALDGEHEAATLYPQMRASCTPNWPTLPLPPRITIHSSLLGAVALASGRATSMPEKRQSAEVYEASCQYRGASRMDVKRKGDRGYLQTMLHRWCRRPRARGAPASERRLPLPRRCLGAGCICSARSEHSCRRGHLALASCSQGQPRSRRRSSRCPALRAIRQPEHLFAAETAH